MGNHCGVLRSDLDDVPLARNWLRPTLGRAALIAACSLVLAAAATAQAPKEPPASCATNVGPRDKWDDRIEITTMPDSVELKWNAPETSLDYFGPWSDRVNTWVLCFPAIPGLPSSYVASDSRYRELPLTTIFDADTRFAGLDHEVSIESLSLRGLAPGIDYWVQYWYTALWVNDEGQVSGRRASTNWIHFLLDGSPQVPAPVNVHGAGVWGPRRLSSSELTVYWSASSGGGIVDSFQIRAKDAASGVWNDWLDVGGGPEARWHTFDGLVPGRSYTFEVRAVNAVGAGPPTEVTGTPRPDSRILEPPCPLPDQLGEPSELHNEKVRMAFQDEGSREATLSGVAMLFGWFVDGEPTAGSVEYNLCRPAFPGSKRYRIEAAMQNPAALSGWGRDYAGDLGYVVAIDGLAAEDQYWIQAVHQPSSEEGGAAELTTWIPSYEAWYRQELHLRARSLFRHWVPRFKWRIGYESYPGVLERFARLYRLGRPDAPQTLVASESSPGSAVLRWDPSLTGGKVERWEYRTAKGSQGDWSWWRTMPGEVDRLAHVVDGLEPGERYVFQVRGTNSEDTGASRRDSLQFTPGPAFGCAEATGYAAELTAVCLGDGRFRFEVTWESPHDGRSGAGMMRRLTDSTGVATFFNPDNVELVFKVLDGTEANGRHWVFYGGLTDLGYTLTVTDTQTGKVETFRNEPGDLCGEGDTSTFGAASASAAGWGGARLVASFPATQQAHWIEPLRTGPSCPSDALCLAGGRFEATVEWTNPATGLTGGGYPLLGTDNTGYMTFFSPDNVELAIKVLDGRAVNDSYWVFAAGLTDVDYTVTVKDTLEGKVKTYSSGDAGQYCTIQDVDAFPQ